MIEFPEDPKTLFMGVGLLMTTLPALIKLSGMKAAVHRDWSDRVTLAESGFDEVATKKLKILQQGISNHLDPEDNFDPTKVVENPAKLLGMVRIFVKVIRRKNRIRLYFRLMIHLIPVMFICTLVTLVSGLFLFFYTGPDVPGPLLQLSQWVFVLSLAIGGLSFFSYIAAQYLLGNAEVFQREEQGGG